MSNEASELRGIIKKILSGDTVIIRDQPRGKAPEEWMRSLAFINVPKLGRRTKEGQVTTDEAYAWEAREFLRKKLIGKEVRYRSETKNAAREFGLLYLGDECINETLVSEGYATVSVRKVNENNEICKRLLQLEKEATDAGKGKHSGRDSVKRELLEIDDVNTLAGKTYPGIVEDVIDGSTLRILLQTSTNQFQNITLMIAGIKCPSLRKEETEPFASEAKYFTECCLLNRDVDVHIDSVGTNQTSGTPRVFGTVKFENRDIAEHLLRQGFARISPQSLNSSVNISVLRAAENEAKQKRLRLYKDYVETPIEAKSQIYEVTEVINGDALKVKELKTNKEKKIFLSWIRAPKSDTPSNSRSKLLYDVPCMFEAREYLRKHLIGKKVTVIHDYTQPLRPSEPGKPDYPEKECCTILVGDKNISEALVAKGLATVIKVKSNDNRSHHYDALQDAEMKAQKSKRGIHGKTAPMRVVDLTNDAPKAKQFLSFLNRGNIDQSRLNAVVEYVYSSSRLKVYIPKENCILNLILAGINAPKSGDSSVGDDALNYVRSLVHQRDVQVSVESLDKVGNFIGYLFYDEKSLNIELLRRGFAELRDAKSNQFIEAEKYAKEKKLNLWKDYKENVETKEDDADEEVSEKVDEKVNQTNEKRDEVVITHISPQLTSIYVQYVSNGPKLDELLNELREELVSNPPLAGSYHVRKGEIVAAKFSVDGCWYRAKVEKIVDKTISVLFIDYGNRENVTIKDICPLPSPKYNVSADGPAPAKEVGLAFVEFPTDVDQLEEARLIFEADVRDCVLHMKREYTDPTNNLDYVTLLHDGKDIVLNLVTDGYILVEKKRRERRLEKVFSEYKAAQENAKRKRANLWQYGDFTEDDAKEFGVGKRA